MVTGCGSADWRVERRLQSSATGCHSAPARPQRSEIACLRAFVLARPRSSCSAVTFPERSGRTVGCVGQAQPAPGHGPTGPEVIARRFRAASPALAWVLGGAVLVLAAAAVVLSALDRSAVDRHHRWRGHRPDLCRGGAGDRAAPAGQPDRLDDGRVHAGVRSRRRRQLLRGAVLPPRPPRASAGSAGPAAERGAGAVVRHVPGCHLAVPGRQGAGAPVAVGACGPMPGWWPSCWPSSWPRRPPRWPVTTYA